MKIESSSYILLFCLIILSSCSATNDVSSDPKTNEKNQENPAEEPSQEIGLVFVDEHIFLPDLTIGGTRVGGLSGIHHHNGSWYLISDDRSDPRYYSTTIDFDTFGFSQVEIQLAISLQDENSIALSNGFYDPESIRADGSGIVWTSEGSPNNNMSPSVNFSGFDGVFRSSVTIPDKYKFFDQESGPRVNGTFEGLTLDTNGNGHWISMELPLIEDGEAPTPEMANSPIRVFHIAADTGEVDMEFAYELDKVARFAALGTSFELNGVVEILAYANRKFLFLERSFSSGYFDGGYNIKIYDVDATNATDISEMDSLKKATYTPATKTLLLDFDDIRSKLNNGMLDNIEGITFGPDFENGNRSVLVVSDNNFNSIVPQVNQLILLEWKE